MAAGARESRIYFVFAVALIAAFFIQSLCASLQKGPAFDELAHIASGLSYIDTGVFRANLQHPPLLKELSAISLRLAGVRWPNTPMAARLIAGGKESTNLEWPIGSDIIASNPDHVLFWARLPFLLLGALQGWLIFIWGRELVGARAALAALFLYAFDPIMIAHGSLVTTDAGMAAFTVLFLLTLWRYLQQPTKLRLFWCGLALGAVLGSKFSAVALLPVTGILLFAGMLPPSENSVAEAPANAPCPCGSGKKYKHCHGGSTPPKLNVSDRAIEAARKMAVPFLAMLTIAAVVIEALYLFSSNPYLYLDGMRLVNADHLAGYQFYLHGTLGDKSPFYFAIAYLIKEPLASVLLAGIGIVILVRRQNISRLGKLFLLLPPAVLFAAYTVGADPMGVRYIIPVLPFAFLAGGVALAAMVGARSIAARIAAGVLAVWLIVEAVGIYPDHLSYFNEMACATENPGRIGLDGGSRCGPLWLDDSNVDWGQGLKQLHAWLTAHPPGRPIRFYYFGMFPPKVYGINSESREIEELITNPPAPGYYVISANWVARASAYGGTWMRQLTPQAIVGHTFYIYDIPGASP